MLDRSTTHIEAGVEVASGGGCRRARLEQSVVRWGVPGVEIQALLNSIVVRRVGGVTSTGMEDLGLGLKVPVARADGGLRVAVLGTLSLPTGARFVTSDEPVPAAALLVDRELSDRVSVSANVGYAAGPGDVDGVTSVTVSPSVVLHPRAAIGAFVGAGVALRWGAR